MRILVGLAYLLMLSAGTAAGVRLLLAARRTRRAPELWIGLATLLPTLAAVLDVVSLRLVEDGVPQAGFALQAVARGVYLVAGAALGHGLQRMFRPDRAWARALAVATPLGLALAWIAWALGGQHSHVTGPTPANFAYDVGRVVPYAWGSVESFAYFGAMRKRVGLGLADPVIAHQFLLWGISSSSMFVLFGVVTLARSFGHSPLEWPPSMLVMSVCGLVGAATIHTAFFPPRFWRRRVVARAAA